MSLFLNHSRPLITTMLKSDNTKDIIEEIKRAKSEGTDAFCLEIELLNTKSRNASDFRDIFSAMEEKPAYITDYRRGNINDYEQTDDELTEEMLLALSCGAKLFDVRGDLFDVQPEELTKNEKAVEKQTELIKEVHRLGGEVIMSSHTLSYLPPEKVLEMAKEQQSRGSDICKVVTAANSLEELNKNIEATMLLKNNLEKQSLFLCIGDYCKPHRMTGPVITNSLYLCVAEGVSVVNQPSMSSAKALMKACGYTDLP